MPTPCRSISRPEPGGLRQRGVMHDGSRSNRGLAATVGTLECPGLGLQPPSLATTATWANKPVRPTRRDQILCARRLVAKALLELDQRAREVCHDGRPGCGGFPICSISVIHAFINQRQ